MIRFAVLLLLTSPLWSEAARLPLPVTGPPGAQAFEALGPTAGVLMGFLVPSTGPLTSWAPVFRPLGADGGLGTEQFGAWSGPLPSRWVKVFKAGAVVAGFRVLVRTGPGTVQTMQLQVFWRGWAEGKAQGALVESPVFGEAAADRDTVRIVELRVPEGAVAVGLYGEVFGGSVVQTSLLVRVIDVKAAPVPSQLSRGPAVPTAPVPPPLPNSP